LLILVQDKKDSYFVGDAAGRADDFASTDRKFALNFGIQFYTPEVRLSIIRMEWETLSRAISQEYFLKISPAPFTLPGFHVSSIKECESVIVFSRVVPLIHAGVSQILKVPRPPLPSYHLILIPRSSYLLAYQV
jgi:bifunctional polynucleotide phosphatase/kinase